MRKSKKEVPHGQLKVNLIKDILDDPNDKYLFPILPKLWNQRSYYHLKSSKILKKVHVYKDPLKSLIKFTLDDPNDKYLSLESSRDLEKESIFNHPGSGVLSVIRHIPSNSVFPLWFHGTRGTRAFPLGRPHTISASSMKVCFWLNSFQMKLHVTIEAH